MEATFSDRDRIRKRRPEDRRLRVCVATSWPIPAKGSKEDKDIQPPHRQAANHHRRVAEQLDGQFTVTMEEPSKTKPRPFGFEITAFGVAAIIVPPMVSAYAAADTPRAG